jgi:hypothetical protein
MLPKADSAAITHLLVLGTLRWLGQTGCEPVGVVSAQPCVDIGTDTIVWAWSSVVAAVTIGCHNFILVVL